MPMALVGENALELLLGIMVAFLTVENFVVANAVIVRSLDRSTSNLLVVVVSLVHYGLL